MKTVARALLIAVGLLLAGSGNAVASDEPAPIPYGCDEVVVIGRVRTVDYTDLTGPDDLLDHGRYDMQVSIKRVLRGKESRRVVPAVGYSHGEMLNDADFLVVLTPATDGGYVIRAANLARTRYKLASTCG